MNFTITSNSYAVLLASHAKLKNNLISEIQSNNAAQVAAYDDIYLNPSSLPNFLGMVASGQVQHGDTHAVCFCRRCCRHLYHNCS